MEGLSPDQESRYTARLLRRARLSDWAFEVELERPKGFGFSAGQSIRLIAGSQGRDYSLANGPLDGTLSFCVSMVPGGAVSPVLARAPLGTMFLFTGPHGVFVLRDSPRPAVWAASGVGVAPFLSMVRAGATGFILLHGVRRVGDLFHREVLEPEAALYVPCLSQEAVAGCYAGRVTGWAGDHLRPGEYDFYLCGNRAMIRDFVLLVDERFPGSRVYTEIFF
ncbi:MAG: FAD-binding oxidoreductase [Spirochaetia bacterium]